MQRDELMALYEMNCRGLRLDPEPAEFGIWHSVLGGYEQIDVHVALQKWWASENGRFPPKPADLVPLAEANARIRRRLETPEFCKISYLGRVKVLVNGKLVPIPCECAECARAREWHNKGLT